MRNIAASMLLAGALQSAYTLSAERAWYSGFEDGYPSPEWITPSDSFVENSTAVSGRDSAWTIVERRLGEPVFSGNRAYKGWVSYPAAVNHRAYPVIHADIATPLVNTFHVYLVVDYARMSPAEWVHLGTWGNYDPVTSSGRWALHTISVRRGLLELAHTFPSKGEYIGPQPQPEFPLHRWVKLTVYIIYEGSTGFVQVWQDGVPTLRAQVSQLAAFPGTRLRTAHWGMYASGSLNYGIQYNDEITICTLSAPLSDFMREPQCPHN